MSIATSPLDESIEPTKEQQNNTPYSKKALKRTKRNSTKYIDARRRAGIDYCNGITSPTLLGKKYGVTRNSIMNWRKWDNWVEIAANMTGEILAKGASHLAQKKAMEIAELEDDINLIDLNKHTAKRSTLSELLKAKIKLREMVMTLRGEATKRTEHLIVMWKPAESQQPRARVTKPARAQVIDDRGPEVKEGRHIDKLLGKTSKEGAGAGETSLLSDCATREVPGETSPAPNTSGFQPAGTVPQGDPAPTNNNADRANMAAQGIDVGPQGTEPKDPDVTATATRDTRHTGLTPGSDTIPIKRNGPAKVLPAGTGTREERRARRAKVGA